MSRRPMRKGGAITSRTVQIGGKQFGWARGDAGDGPAVGKIKLHASGFGSIALNAQAHHIQYCIPERAETA